MEREVLLTVPDDESLLVDTEGPQLGGIDDIPLEMRGLAYMYVSGVLLLLVMLTLNYVSWRHYAKALSSVLLEPSRRAQA